MFACWFAVSRLVNVAVIKAKKIDCRLIFSLRFHFSYNIHIYNKLIHHSQFIPYWIDLLVLFLLFCCFFMLYRCVVFVFEPLFFFLSGKTKVFQNYVKNKHFLIRVHTLHSFRCLNNEQTEEKKSVYRNKICINEFIFFLFAFKWNAQKNKRNKTETLKLVQK